MTLMTTTLPDKFKQLEPWSAWAGATEGERYALRAACDMEGLRAFYEALKPNMEEIIQYLSAFPWGATLTEEDKRLHHLGMTYMEAAVPIELGWKQPLAQDSFPVSRVELPERP
jgi:hypothetical protein